MRIILSFFIFLLVISCEREEGPGGKSSVEGTLMIREYNSDFSLMLNEYPAQDKDIYINYGDDEVIGDDLETSYNGKFRFSYLQPGKYIVWYYSDDTVPGSQSEIVMEQEVNLGKSQNKDLGKIFAYDTKEFDEGSGSICGKIYLINYKNTATPPYTESDIKDITPAQEEDVYLIYNEHQTYDEHEETNYAGEFCFTDLIQGQYMIYVYSEDLPGGSYDFNSENIIVDENSNGTFDLVLYQVVEITEQGEQIRLDEFYIEQE